MKGLAGKLDIDRPLASYNVTPSAFWGHKQEYWPQITARHLITHTSGLGKGPPGRKFEYNSGEHIQCLGKEMKRSDFGWEIIDLRHLSLLIGAITADRALDIVLGML